MNSRVCYHITPRPLCHQFEVSLRFHPKDGEALATLSLPAWIPGSYMIREFSKNIVHMEMMQSHKPLGLTKLDKHTWQAVLRDSGPVHVLYRVYAWDMSVRTSYLDTLRGFFNGTSVCMRVHGHEQSICEIDIAAPEGLSSLWRVSTGLAPARAQDEAGVFTGDSQTLRYLAQNYDDLIDCPVEMGVMANAQFVALGVKHQVAISGACDDIDLDRLCKDLQLVCETHIKLFDPRGEAPFSRYVFLIHATDNGYGGLEHRNSTALLCSRKDLPHIGMKDSHPDYRTFLGLCSHEYFHAWNVKRIKPAAFMDYHLDRETYTRQLWLFEGFTSYYDDLALLNCGLLTQEQYGEALGKTYSSVMKHKGHTQQSLSESSFDAWTKYYRQDENSPNTIVSYYAKGSLVALCLDALIRKETEGCQSLDDVMRWLWLNYGKANRGLGEDEFAGVVHAATGLDVAPFLKKSIDTTEPLPVGDALKTLGYELRAVEPEMRCDWGLVTTAVGDFLHVKQVRNGSAGELAGLAAGDVLIAIDDFKATADHMKRLQSRKQAGDSSRVLLLRRERAMEMLLVWQAADVREWKIKPVQG
jgi:predicted metalloprotease with PDZ domain